MAEEPRDTADLGLDPRPRPRSGVGKWIALGCGAALLLAFLCCGGGLLFMRSAFSTAEKRLRYELEVNDAVVQNLGVVQEVEFDWGRTFGDMSSGGLVFRVEGTRGTGFVHLPPEVLDDPEIAEGQLELPGGERIDLFAPEPSPPPDEGAADEHP